MRRLAAIWIALLWLAPVAAAGDAPAAPTSGAAPASATLTAGAPLEPVTVLRADDLGYIRRGQRIVRDADTWKVTWAELYAASGRVPPARPPVDFAKELVVVVSSGRAPPGGTVMVVTGATLRGRDVVVRIRDEAPPRRLARLPGSTFPVHAVRLPRVEGEVLFEVVSPPARKR